MKPIRIVFFDAKDYDIQSFETALPAYREAHPDLPECEMKFFDTRLSADTVNLAKGADVVCIFVNDMVDGAMAAMLAGMGVKLIALRCAGYNNVDVEACFGKIHVVRVPAYSPYAVAEHAAALLLTSIRRIHKAYIRTRDFNFSLNGLTGFDLHGKTVGVIGTGKIGACFIDICLGFGMKVLAFDKFPNERLKEKGVRYTDLEELWKECDILSLHCPLTDETAHMINRDSIAKMKKGVVILNTSRGGLIDSEDLLEGIKSRQVGAACLDVYEEESSIFFHDFAADLHAERDRFLPPGLPDAGCAGKHRGHDPGQHPHLPRGGYERERAVLQMRQTAGVRREKEREVLLKPEQQKRAAS